MAELLEREQLLESSGYEYYLKRMFYNSGCGANPRLSQSAAPGCSRVRLRETDLKKAASKVAIRERPERVYDAFDELEDVLEPQLRRNAEREAH